MSVSPPVFLTGIPDHDYLGFARPFARQFGNIDAGFIVFPTWSLERPEFPAAMRERFIAHTARFPRHRFRFICNSAREAELLQEQGLAAELLNKNFTVSDAIFRPLDGVEVAFDAIYNARFVPDKRHDLARLIERVAYLAYVEPQPQRRAEFTSIFEAAMASNPHHSLLNPLREGLPVGLAPAGVNRALSSAAVGLVLSEVEGSSYCSMEYMLAGLPVVSTPSKGGRDVYFDPDYCIVCPPDPVAVREAVTELKARHIPRNVIRARTLDKIAPPRARFLRLIDELLAEFGVAPRFAGRDWPFSQQSGVPWAPYDAHLAKLVQGQHTGLARGLGLDPRLLAGVQLFAIELELIARAVRSRPGCRLLIFGCGNDSAFWEALNVEGVTAFVEDNPGWAAGARQRLTRSPVHLVEYGTRLSQWRTCSTRPPGWSWPCRRSWRVRTGTSSSSTHPPATTHRPSAG